MYVQISIILYMETEGYTYSVLLRYILYTLVLEASPAGGQDHAHASGYGMGPHGTHQVLGERSRDEERIGIKFVAKGESAVTVSTPTTGSIVYIYI
jgi:hypothetical protein